MKQNSNTFYGHVESFIDSHALLPSEKNNILSVSGGMDSMCLLYFFMELKRKGRVQTFKVLCFDHGLRSCSAEDSKFVVDFCLANQIECEVVAFNLKLSSNIEFMARERRQNIYQKYQQQGYWIYLGHHIDDAFEWHLLQQFKSSTKCLGIPLVRGKLVRPFLCVTKEVINQFAKNFNIPFREDGSNSDLRFERNYIRHEVIPSIKKRFPAYLKHFVFQMNRQALGEKRFRLQAAESTGVLKRVIDPLGGLTLYMPADILSLQNYKEDLFAAIHIVSNKKRGSLSLEVDKLITAYANGKKGPMSFSGNVGCILTKGSLYFYPKAMDNELAMSKMKRLRSLEQLWKHPYITIDNRAVNKLCPSLKRAPEWLAPLQKRHHLVATSELYTQVFVTGRIKVEKLIHCKFCNVRLI